jgi:aspartyl-tRNA(Asn)/glutamyl-tRNA(Gln) amidotransferase subunit B
MPELPDAKKTRYIQKYQLPYTDAVNLAGDPELSAFFDQALAAAGLAADQLARSIANLLLNDVSAWLNQNQTALGDAAFTPRGIVELTVMQNEGTISSRQARDVFAEMAAGGFSPTEVIEAKGLYQVSDSKAIEAVIDQILADNGDKIAEYQSGKTGLLGYFVGLVMREMKGQGNPQLINEILATKLKE